MDFKSLAFVLLLMQACGTILAQTPELVQLDSPGLLQRLLERARETKVKVQGYGELAQGYAEAFYEDHIQPVTDPYVEWASHLKDSMWDKIQSNVENYLPFMGN